MSREVGDYYFNKMFPDQTQPKPEPRKPTRADRMLDWFFAAVGGGSDQEPAGEYEYKTVKIPQAKGTAHMRKRNAATLERRLAAEGWELVNVQPRGVFEFGTKDTVTVRRKR